MAEIMDWRIVLVLVVAAAGGIGFVVLGVLLHRRGVKLNAALREVERQKRKTESALDKIRSLQDQIELEGQTDDEALDELARHLLDGGDRDPGNGAGMDGS